MADPSPSRLRALAAEIRAQLAQLRGTTEELAAVRSPAASESVERVIRYAAAAMLDTFYSGVERLLERVARSFGTMPEGPRWHRDLLEAAALDIDRVRPAPLRPATASSLRAYLAFRHRFRNLYLFDLEDQQMRPLIDDAAAIRAAVEAELERFAAELEAMASRIEHGDVS